MSGLRAAKSGFALEAQKKTEQKFDQAIAAKCMVWVKELTGADIDTSGDHDAVFKDLQDGIVLLKLKEKIANPSDPKPPKNCKPRGGMFNWMERISIFNKFVKEELGVKDEATFCPEYLTEAGNIPQVILCLESVARKCNGRPGLTGFGPKEAEKCERHFTEEQLNQGKAVIGLQMGSNKGASQSGQNFGKGRHITD